ncbi:MAG: ATP/GTP-binding protein [Actinobacteria bacterium]|nr:ATP/GTP-binding protein [Actinomycetota bacterium]
MSPRSNRRRPEDGEPRLGRTVATQRTEPWCGEEYSVRYLSGTGSGRTYRCPGCDHEVHAVAPHVVVWPAEDLDADRRRHWHTPCWRARDRRAVRDRRRAAGP